MKWFKHDASAMADAKLKKVKMKYGMQGYGLYWYCLELIAQNVEKHNLSFELEHDAEIIAIDTGIHQELVEEMMMYMVQIKLFESSEGRIFCLKMATRTDEYTQKLIKSDGILDKLSRHSPDNVQTLSRQCPTGSRIKSELIEEKRREENIHAQSFARFWDVYPKKKSKGTALKAWTKLKPDEQLVEKIISTIETAKTSEDWTKAGGQYIPYPASWLNAVGWDDEISEETQELIF